MERRLSANLWISCPGSEPHLVMDVRSHPSACSVADHLQRIKHDGNRAKKLNLNLHVNRVVYPDAFFMSPRPRE